MNKTLLTWVQTLPNSLFGIILRGKAQYISHNRGSIGGLEDLSQCWSKAKPQVKRQDLPEADEKSTHWKHIVQWNVHEIRLNIIRVVKERKIKDSWNDDAQTERKNQLIKWRDGQVLMPQEERPALRSAEQIYVPWLFLNQIWNFRRIRCSEYNDIHQY